MALVLQEEYQMATHLGDGICNISREWRDVPDIPTVKEKRPMREFWIKTATENSKSACIPVMDQMPFEKRQFDSSPGWIKVREVLEDE